MAQYLVQPGDYPMKIAKKFGITFDQFTYNNLNQRYWSAHAVNYFVVKVP